MDIHPQQSKPPVNVMLHLLTNADGSMVQGPSYPVPRGCSVYLRAHNGTDVGNLSSVVVGKSAGAVRGYLASNTGTAPGNFVQSIEPNTQIGYPCENLSEIFLAGSAAALGNGPDGITISIQS